MISGFCCPCHGFMVDPDDANYKSFLFFEAGRNREGWFTNDHLVKQLLDTDPLIKKLHPDCELHYGFDQSMTHKAKCKDGLDATRLNLSDGGAGKQAQRKGWYFKEVTECECRPKTMAQAAKRCLCTPQQQRKVLKKFKQESTNHLGKPRGLESLLRERGKFQSWLGHDLKKICKTCDNDRVNRDAIIQDTYATVIRGRHVAAVRGDKGSSPKELEESTTFEFVNREATAKDFPCCAFHVLDNEPDYALQKPWLEEEVLKLGHNFFLYPKYHCELNFIEMIWGYVKSYHRSRCEYSYKEMTSAETGLNNTLIKVLPLAFVRKAFNRCCRYIDGYTNHNLSGPLLEFCVRKYKSHRRLGEKLAETIAKFHAQERDGSSLKRKR